MKITTHDRSSDAWAFRSLLTFPSGTFIAVACFTTALYAAASALGLRGSTASDAIVVHCSGDGSAQIYTGHSAAAKILWDPQLFLSITLGFGHLSFAEAKALDFAWDLIVGSGGQVLLCYLVYPLFRRVLLARIERGPMPLSTYTTLAFNGVAGTTTWALLSDLFSWRHERVRRLPRRSFGRAASLNSLGGARRSASSKIDRVLWVELLVTFCYLLAFAKALSLMTGYQAIATAIVTLKGEADFVTVSTAVIAPIIVHDGSRIGYQDDYGVTKSDPNYLALSSYMNLTTETTIPHQGTYVINCTSTFENGEPRCAFIGQQLSSTDRVDSSNVTIRDQTGHFNNLLVPLPYLSITTHDNLKDPDTLVNIGGATIAYRYLANNAKCLPSQNYKWGFSSILLFTFCLASLLFLAVLQAMAWRLYEYSRSDRMRRPVNVYQDALDIVQELSHYYEQPIRDLDLSNIEEDELRRKQAVIVLDTIGLPESRHTERQGESRSEEIYSAFSFDLPYQWYRRLAKLLNSHWADENVIVYWPAKREDAMAKVEQAEEAKRSLAAEAASMAEQSEAGDGPPWADRESVALRTLNSDDRDPDWSNSSI